MCAEGEDVRGASSSRCDAPMTFELSEVIPELIEETENRTRKRLPVDEFF